MAKILAHPLHYPSALRQTYLCILLVPVVTLATANLGYSQAEEVDKPAPPKAAENDTAEAKRDRSQEPGVTQEPGVKWIRIRRDRDGEPQTLQTAIVRYVAATGPKSGITVDLIGAVHVGDKSYFRALNQRFRQYDALLYELVAPEGTRVERGRGTSSIHPIGAVQNGLKSLLGLEHQLEWIDYTRKNFVHADMSPSQMLDRMEERGETFLQMYFRLVGAEIARQSQQQSQGNFAELDLLVAFFAADPKQRIKVALAKQFEDVETMMAGFGGPDGSTIITERNKIALEVLRRELDKGHKRLAVFYGAGHMGDMAERLQRDFHMKPTTVTWVDAWNLQP